MVCSETLFSTFFLSFSCSDFGFERLNLNSPCTPLQFFPWPPAPPNDCPEGANYSYTSGWGSHTHTHTHTHTHNAILYVHPKVFLCPINRASTCSPTEINGSHTHIPPLPLQLSACGRGQVYPWQRDLFLPHRSSLSHQTSSWSRPQHRPTGRNHLPRHRRHLHPHAATGTLLARHIRWLSRREFL